MAMTSVEKRGQVKAQKAQVLTGAMLHVITADSLKPFLNHKDTKGSSTG
jgi:hypothetical protein